VEPARRRRLAVLIIAAALLAAVILGLVLRRPPGAPGSAPRRVIPGESDRVVVEVLNASGRVGLARAATRRLRDAGLDVVYFGNDDANDLDSTAVLLRRGGAAAAERVVEALGVGTVRAAPDPARLVDVTVRLGADFARLASLVGEP
jgi:hypothetical protein